MEIEEFFEKKELDESPMADCVIPRMPWHEVTITPESPLFKLMQGVLEKVEVGQESITVQTINKDRSDKVGVLVKDTYKFVFEWQSDNQHSVQVFKKGEDSYATAEGVRQADRSIRREENPVSSTGRVRA